MSNKIPRKAMLIFNFPAEIAIQKSIDEVEKIGADPRLTEAVVKLSDAKDLVSSFMDEQLKK